MRQVTVLCVGKLKETYWQQAQAEYQKRLGRFCRFDICELPESLGEGDMAVRDEGKRILAKVPKDAYVISLCIEGKMLDSVAFSKKLEKIALAGNSRICFVIGGSWGLTDKVKSRADLKLSFSNMTFPHQLFRILLCEQLYRAFCLQKNIPYHK